MNFSVTAVRLWKFIDATINLLPVKLFFHEYRHTVASGTFVFYLASFVWCTAVFFTNKDVI